MPDVEALNSAYGCFLFVGIVNLVSSSLFAINKYLAFYLIIPWCLMIAVLLVGIGLALRHRHHEPLMWLAVSTVLGIIAGVIVCSAETLGTAILALVISVLWSALMVIIPMQWFIKGRRRYLEKLAPAHHSAPLS